MSEPDDLYAQVARLHMAGIDQGFLATLGEAFLIELYRAIDGCPEAVLLTEHQDGRLLGFVAGATGMGPVYRRLLRRWPRLIAPLAPIAANPAKLRRLVELLRHVRRGESGGADLPADLPGFELLSIAVAPDARRTGIARRLYGRLMAVAREAGAPGFRIIVGEGLDDAHRFYESMGARRHGEIAVHGSTRSTIYVQPV